MDGRGAEVVRIERDARVRTEAAVLGEVVPVEEGVPEVVDRNGRAGEAVVEDRGAGLDCPKGDCDEPWKSVASRMGGYISGVRNGVEVVVATRLALSHLSWRGKGSGPASHNWG